MVVDVLRFSNVLDVFSNTPAIQVYDAICTTRPHGPDFSISLLDLAETGLKESLLERVNTPGNTRSWQMQKRHGVTCTLILATTEDGSAIISIMLPRWTVALAKYSPDSISGLQEVTIYLHILTPSQ